jgi:hypothetical protein
MGGDDVVCEGDDDSMRAFLHCTTRDLALWLVLGGYEQPDHSRNGYQGSSRLS